MRTREQRQRDTAAQPDCIGCGNKARLDSNRCGRCDLYLGNRIHLLEQLRDCETVEDLKGFILDHVLEGQF
jgi:hypothetical protein